MLFPSLTVSCSKPWSRLVAAMLFIQSRSQALNSDPNLRPCLRFRGFNALFSPVQKATVASQSDANLVEDPSVWTSAAHAHDDDCVAVVDECRAPPSSGAVVLRRATGRCLPARDTDGHACYRALSSRWTPSWSLRAFRSSFVVGVDCEKKPHLSFFAFVCKGVVGLLWLRVKPLLRFTVGAAYSLYLVFRWCGGSTRSDLGPRRSVLENLCIDSGESWHSVSRRGHASWCTVRIMVVRAVCGGTPA